MALTFMNTPLQDTAKISDAMGAKLENYTVDVDLEEVGIVEKIGDGIATVIGMKTLWQAKWLNFRTA